MREKPSVQTHLSKKLYMYLLHEHIQHLDLAEYFYLGLSALVPAWKPNGTGQLSVFHERQDAGRSRWPGQIEQLPAF